jgi:Cu/Ag efflux pump CusA
VILPPLARRPGWAVTILVVAFATTGWAVMSLGEEFLPDVQENDFLMHWIEKPGTSLEAMRRITVNVSKELRTVPEVRNFGSHIGRAEVADEVFGPNFTELWISVDPKADHAPTLKKIVSGYTTIY